MASTNERDFTAPATRSPVSTSPSQSPVASHNLRKLEIDTLRDSPKSQTSQPANGGSSMKFKVLTTLLLPVLMAWWGAAFMLAWLATFMVWPSWLLAQRLYWACPFIPYIFKHQGGRWQWLMRIGFESSYCINVLTRFFTLPMRRDLPAFYIVGFPKCGTTSLAEHLKRHPGIDGPAGLPYHEAMCKETHFFEGVLGRTSAHSATLYRSFFPCVLKRWLAEVVKGVPKWMCFDACPVHACLPYVARRIAAVTPNAKIIIMMREPTSGVFSAEVMLSDIGVPLGWKSLTEPVEGPADPRFKGPTKSEQELWEQVEQLDVKDPLPAELPHGLYFTLHGVLRCGQYADLLQPYLTAFPPENIMIINFNDFRSRTEEVVREVLRFVGASEEHFTYTPLPPAMQVCVVLPVLQNSYKGRCMHPSVAQRLRSMYAPGIRRLQAMLQQDLDWGVDEEAP